MILVVDASVVIKWFVEEAFHAQALVLLGPRHDLHGPDLLLAEVANVAWKKAVRGEIDDADARDIVRTAASGIVTVHPSVRPVLDIANAIGVAALDPATRLGERALEIALALKHPVYDCLYLALAEALDSVVVTADGALARRLDGTVFAGLAAFLPDWVSEDRG